MGPNRQVPELPHRQALEGLAIEHLPGDRRRIRVDSNVRQVVQRLQLPSRPRGMEGEEKGVLRASPCQVVNVCVACRSGAGALRASSRQVCRSRGAGKSQWKGSHGKKLLSDFKCDETGFSFIYQIHNNNNTNNNNNNQNFCLKKKEPKKKTTHSMGKQKQ